MYGWVMAGALFGGLGTAHAQEEASTEPVVRLSARGGYTNYSRLDFVTGELEGAFRIGGKFYGVAGVAVYGVLLETPVQRQLDTGKLKEWAAMAPLHLGARYQFSVLNGDWLPFAGADVLTARYYQGDEGEGAWAIGGRLRGGLDWMVVDSFGIHANVGLGWWWGDRWDELATGLPESGVVLQVSAGVTYTL